MAQIVYRVSGGDGAGKRVSRRFRNTDQGREDARAFAANLKSARTVYDVRHRVAGRVATRTFARRKDADEYATKLAHEQMTGYSIDPAGGRLTLEELSKRWIASNPGKRKSTIGRDQSALDAQILPALGQTQLRSIRQADVQALVNDWTTRLAPKTVIRTYGTLRAALAYAVSADLIARSPCRDIRLPQVARSDRRPLAVDDVGEIARAVDVRWRAMVWVAAFLGLRWGEVAGLRVGRLDLKARTLTVAEIVARDDHGRPILGPPKSLAGIRTLAVPAALVRVMKDHLAATGLTAEDKDQFVFPAPEGGPWAYSNFRRRVWLPAVTKAGLEGVTFHDLRRAAATALVLENVDLKTAQTRLGHSDPRLTLAVYAQATTEADRAAANAVSRRFAKALRSGPRDKRATPAAKTRSSRGLNPG